MTCSALLPSQPWLRKVLYADFDCGQIVAPLAPLMVTLRIRIQGATLWWHGVPVVKRFALPQPNAFFTNRFERWPTVVHVPSGSVTIASAVVADRLLRRAAARLPLRLVFPRQHGDRRRRPNVTVHAHFTGRTPSPAGFDSYGLSADHLCAQPHSSKR